MRDLMNEVRPDPSLVRKTSYICAYPRKRNNKKDSSNNKTN